MPETSAWFGKTIELEELKWFNSHPVAFFKGVSDRTTAEGMIKAILLIDEDPAEEPEEDAWYDHQLVGLKVVRDGAEIGRISRLEHFPAQDLLVIEAAGGEVMVPFVKAIVPSVDIAAGVVTITPPMGLFETLPDSDAEADSSEGAEAEN